MKTKAFLFAGALALTLGLASCSKEEAASISAPAEEITAQETPDLAEAVDILTKSLTTEDLEGLSLFLKGGSTESSIYLQIAKDGSDLVTGELSRISGESFAEIGIDITVLGSVPVAGTVDAYKLPLYLGKAWFYLWNEELLEKYLEKANSVIDITVLGTYYISFEAVEDEETGDLSIGAFIVNGDDETQKLSISDLIAMFS